MGGKSKSQKIPISYNSRRTKEDRDFSRVAKAMGERAMAHHFARGRSVVFFEDGKIVRVYKDGRKEVVEDMP